MLLLRILCAFSLSIPFPAAAFGEAPQAGGGAQRNAPAADAVPEALLSAWSRESSGIRKLKGEHLRREYDEAFGTERLSQGVFYFEAPDKGRIDVEPVEVTQRMIDQRKNGDVPVRRVRKGPKAGRPFELQKDQPEKWVCDGRSVFMVDESQQTAIVQPVPAEMQGTNIMNSSLPFLFGMPPQRARQRFELSLTRPLKRGDAYAYIKAVPKTRIDPWRSAEVILDLKTFLPLHVKISNTDGNTETVYSFGEIKKNANVPLITKIFLGNSDPFKLNLKGYHVDVINPQAAGRNPMPQGPQVVPQVVGLAHDTATKRLELVGYDVEVLRGGPAANEKDVFRVRDQKPRPGTSLEKGKTVQIFVYERRRQ